MLLFAKEWKIFEKILRSFSLNLDKLLCSFTEKVAAAAQCVLVRLQNHTSILN